MRQVVTPAKYMTIVNNTSTYTSIRTLNCQQSN